MDQAIQEIAEEVIQQAIEKATQKPVPDFIQNEPQTIVFYCKDCKEKVEAKRKGKSLTFVCPKCSQSNVAIGTQKSIENYYHLNP